MSRIAYVNGRYRPHHHAGVHVEDRGYQFADGVYEVVLLHRGALIDEEAHLDRLGRSLDALRMRWPIARSALRVVLREVARRNRATDRGIVYVQVTRGVAPRNHAFPAGVRSVLVATARILPAIDVAALDRGVRVVTEPDLRWKRADVKSVSLLPNVLAKQQAVEAGAFEAWLTEADGTITEGTSSNAWIVTPRREIITRQADHAILNGVTRRAVLEIAGDLGLDFVERPFTATEVKLAAEAFLTSTTALVKPVVGIDEATIGDGRAGPITRQLFDRYLAHLDAQAEGAVP